MEASPSGGPGLKRSLSVWAAVGISVALMAPSMAANINPQGSASYAGRAVPLTFLIAAVGVLLVAYSFVRLCQYFHHAGSVYAFVGATLGPRTGVIAGWGLLGTYTFYAVVTSAAAGIFGTAFLQEVKIWPNPPTWAPFVLLAVALVLALALAIMPARRGAHVLLSVEGTTVALILIVTAVVLVRLLAGNAPGHEHFTWSVFSVAPGTGTNDLFLGVVFGFLSFAGFEAAATLGEEATRPTRDIPRAILGTAIFGGVYFVIVTAVEMMAFGATPAGVKAFIASPSLLGDLGSSYVGNWVGDVITLGTAISAFGCCLACVVGAARLLYALSRDTAGPRGLGQSSTRWGTPVWATFAVVAMAAVIVIVETAGRPRRRLQQLPVVRHHRHADPAGRVRAGHGGLHHAGVRPAQAPGADVADRGADRGPRRAGLHAVPQRVAVPVRDGRVVPHGVRRLAGGRGHRGDLRAAHGAQARRGAGRPRGHRGAGDRGTRSPG